MIVFHEGLPGAGKSYEALAVRIIPALKAGRAVDAYVEGLDHDRIAAAAGITPDQCRDLLKPLTREMVLDVAQHARDNAIVILDEAQNFWGNRAKLSPETTQFVTEHRHRGIDIVLMGQDLRDIHAIWRRRVELKLCFLKLSGLGTSKRYSVTTYRHLGGDQFERLGVQVNKYDPAIFGTYKSHVAADTNTADYQDARAVLWNHPGFKFGAPLLLVLALWGGWKMWAFFHPAPAAAVSGVTAPASAQKVALTPPTSPAPLVAAASAAKPPKSPLETRLAGLSERGRIRLAGLISTPTRIAGVIEWMDGNARVLDRLDIATLREMGVQVAVFEGFVKLALGDWQEVATMWPLESDGVVSSARIAAMRPAEPAAPVAAGGAGDMPTSLGSSRPGWYTERTPSPAPKPTGPG